MEERMAIVKLFVADVYKVVKRTNIKNKIIMSHTHAHTHRVIRMGCVTPTHKQSVPYWLCHTYTHIHTGCHTHTHTHALGCCLTHTK